MAKQTIERHADVYGIDQSIMILEKHNKRLFLFAVLLLILFVATNALWIYHESKYTDEATTTEITQDADADNCGNATINDGVEVCNYGSRKTDSENHH